MFAFFAVTAVTKFSSDGSILYKFCYEKRSYKPIAHAIHLQSGQYIGSDNRLVSDIGGDYLHECIEGHHTEVLTTPGAHCNGTCRLLLISNDKDIRQLLH